MKEPDLSLLVPAEELRGDDLQDTHLLNQSLEEATLFLGKFKWCTKVVRRFFGFGVGGVIAVFLFEIVPGSPDVDRLLWVVAGDIPPAYLVTDDASTPRQALLAYVEEMSAWVAAVQEGRSVEDLIPVNVDATEENAENLAGRLNFIREQVLADT